MNADWLTSEELDEGPSEPLFTSGSAATSDCDLNNVNVTEVYHSSNDWIEFHNSGNTPCDLGGWHIRDDDTTSGMVVDNWTNITAGGFLLFESAQGDFSFDIGYSDSILVSTRDVSTENATVVTTLDYYGRDNEGYSTSRDGSWELCDGVWDYNEPDEMTPNATNACAGEPLVLSTLDSSGSWTDNPGSIDSGMSTLGWNTANLHTGGSYYLYYTWYTDLGNSQSRGITFTADGSYIEFDLSSPPDWTCEVRVDAYLRNESSSVAIEYFDEYLVVDCDEHIEAHDFEMDDGEGYVHDGDFVGSGAMAGAIGFKNGKLSRQYRATLVISFDGDVESFADNTCEFNRKTCAIEYDISIPSSICEVEFKLTAWVRTTAKWNEVGEHTWDLGGSCNTQSSHEVSALSLYAMMDDGTGGQSWTMVADDGVNDVLDMSTNRTQAFYWDIDQGVVGTDVRLNFFYEGHEVYDEYFTYDGQPIYWNASIAVTECDPYVYAYLYHEMPDGSNVRMGYFHEEFTTECEDRGDVDLHVHNMTYTGADTNNGTTDMIWNLSDLEVGKEYLFEWLTYRSSSYTASGEDSVYGEYYNSTTFTATSDYAHIDWTLDAHGSWCDLDVNGYLYEEFDASQEWWDEGQSDDEKWTLVESDGHDLNPTCDGTEVAPYEPVSLLYLNESDEWVEVDESTNLSAGIHSMRWEVSGTSDEHPLRLHTRHETALNSSYINSYHWETGDFTIDWELPISSWSCNIDFEFDLDLQTVGGNSYRMDYETGNPFIDGPCGGVYDISQNEDPVDLSVSIIGADGNADDLDEVHELSEGENTFRWEVDDPVDGHFHSVWMYLWYNGKIQQTLSTGFLGDSQDASGEWVASIDEDACDIRLYAEMSIREYNGWHKESTSEHFGFSGNTSACDYGGSQVTLSVLDESGSWVENPDYLATGNNQIRLNIGDISLPENYTYYISSQIDGTGVSSVSKHTYFNIGTPSHYGYSYYNDYDGGDVYYNFTVAEWTCTATAYTNIYIISNDGGWHTAATMRNRYYQNNNCDPIGELSLSRFDDGHWEHDLQSGWDMQAGVTDLYWNMSKLNIGERYKLTFYAYVDGQIYYPHGSGEIWHAQSENELWHFDFDIGDDTCTVYGYADLRVWWDGGFRTINSVYFHPHEPCVPPFDVLFEDPSSGWTDATSAALPVGSTEILFDLSDFGHGEYEVDYYWSGDRSGGHGWYYDIIFNVTEASDGFNWTINPDDDDCEIDLRVRVYDRDNQQSIGHGTYHLELDGPCHIPAVLEVSPAGEQGWTSPDSETVTAGENSMRWNLEHLHLGRNYTLEYYWSSTSQSTQWFYHQFTHDGSNIDWTLNATTWDCYIHIHSYVHDQSNGSRIQSRTLNLYPDDCQDGGQAEPQVNRTYGWTDVSANQKATDGDMDVRWHFEDLVANQAYAIEWLEFRNDDYTAHHVVEFTPTSDEYYQPFNLTVDADSTCSIRLEASLYVVVEGKYIEVFQGSDNLYPNCNYEGVFNQFSLTVLDQETQEYNAPYSIGNGDQSFRFDLSGLIDNKTYHLHGDISTNFDSEHWHWGQFTPSERPDYVQVDMEISEWSCTVSAHLYVYVQMLDGGSRTLRSGTDQIDSPCIDSGDVELEIDGEEVGYGMGLENGSNDMTWNLTDLAQNQSYTFDWRVQFNGDYVSYGSESWNTGTNQSALLDWTIEDLNTGYTCYARVYWRTFMDASETSTEHWIEMDSGSYYESFPCEQPAYPEDNFVSIYAEEESVRQIGTHWNVSMHAWMYGSGGNATIYELMDDGTTGDSLCNLTAYHNSTTEEIISDHCSFSAQAIQIFAAASNESYSAAYYPNIEVNVNGLLEETFNGTSELYGGIQSGGAIIANLTGADYLDSEVEFSDVLALDLGEHDIELRFENLSMGEVYRVYFYHSGTGFGSESYHHYFTFDGTPLELTMPVAPWACDIYWNWDIHMYDFRYPDSGYNSWWLGSDSGYMDGPCLSASYNSTQAPGFAVSYDEDTEFVEGANNITLYASDLQANFPYYVESRVNFDGYLNELEYSTWFAKSGMNETFTFEIDIPGHVCEVTIYSRLYVRTNTTGITQLGSNESYEMDGPCDDSDGDSQRTFPLYALIDGTWTLATDELVIEYGETQMYWDLSGLEEGEEVYFNFYPNGAYVYDVDRSQDVTADEHPFQFTWTMHEFSCSPYMHSYMYLKSPWTGSHYTGNDYIYFEDECIDGGNISLAVLDDGGAEIEIYQNGQGGQHDLLPGTNHFAWDLTDLADGYQYELYWYQSGGNHSHYEYFTASSNGTWVFEFNTTIDEYECDVHYYAYLRPMSQVTGDYVQVESFSFHPKEPCYPPFDVLAMDSSGDYTIDALHPNFVLGAGVNHLFMDFSDLGNNTEWSLEWYYDDSDGWFGWFYDDITVITSDDDPDGIHLNISMDFWDCQAYFYTSLRNVTADGQDDYIESRTRYLEGPCLNPLSLQVGETESLHHGTQLELGDNDMTWTFDHLTTGVEYRLEWYWNNGSESSGWSNHYFTYDGSNELSWTLPVGTFECDPYAQGRLHYSSNGSNVGNYQTWHFDVPDCADPWLEVLDSDGDHVDSDDIEIDGDIDLFWVIHDLPDTDHQYTLDMRLWENGNLVDYRYESFNFSSADSAGDIHIDLWSGAVANDVCELRFQAALYVLADASSNDWNHITGQSRYFYPDCEPLPGQGDNFASGDGNYVNFYLPDADGELFDLGPVAHGYVMPAGENTIEVQFENLTEGENYRLYLYHSGTGFPSESDYHYFTYDGSGSMDWVVPVASWACDIHFSWNIRLYDFRYPDSGYSSWELRSDSINTYGPCLSVSYDSSQEAVFEASFNESTTFDSGSNTVNLTATGLQDMFPYAAELEVRFDGYMNSFESQMAFVDNFTTFDWDFTFDVPAFVCDIDLYARLYVKTDTYSNSHVESIYVYDAEGPCDGTEGDARLSTPLYAWTDGSWTLVNDDTTFEPGIYEMQWDISWMGDTEYYFSANAPNWGWSDYVTADDGPIEWTLQLDEFDCNPSIYSYMRQHSDFSGWHYYDYTYLYPETECIEDAGDIELEVDGVTYQSYQGYDHELLPGTTNLTWSLSGLLEGYDYEMQWYRGGSECCDWQYEPFTADSSGTASFDFELTIDEHECDVYYRGYLIVWSNVTGHSRQIESFSFYPQEPCVPVFDLAAADDDGNMTIDAMDEAFALSPGWNDLAIDLSGMVEGSSYYVEWYYSGTNSWNGWYYHDLPGSDGYDDTGANGTGANDTGANGTDDAGWYEPYAIGHMIHFSIWMGEFDCDAHLYARVINTTDGQWDEMGGYNVYIPGPCLKPFALQLNGSDLDNMASEGFQLELGDNGMTWAFDNLDDGVDYRLDWYWNNGSYGNSDSHYFTYNETDSSGDLDWNLPVGIWDCQAEAQASLYYDGNGSHIHGTEYWYFHVPDCAQVQVNLTDANGNHFGSNYSDYGSIDDLTSELTWMISGLPEGYEYALETRTYLNDIMHGYLYETFSDSPNATSSFSFDLDTTGVCDLYFESTLYYFDGYYNDWRSVSYNHQPFYQDCDGWQTLYPYSILADQDGDGTYEEMDMDGGTIDYDGMVPMMVDFSDLTDGDYRAYYRWHTPSSSGYFDWEDLSDTNHQFEFEVPVSQWDCWVEVYVSVYYQNFRGWEDHLTSRNHHFDTDCSDPGEVSLELPVDQNSTIDWNLSWELTGLVNGATYALDWWARVNGDFVLYEYATWEASQENNTFLWDLQIDNSTTCELEIRYRMFVDTSDTSVPNWLHMREDSWYWYPGCDEWVYPEDSYVNIYADVNGTWEELDDWSETTNSSHVLPAGEHDIEVRFENLSVGATYRLYLYHSGTGFYDESEYHYFTYDGTPMGLTIPVAPWACDVYFSWDMQLYDFRYPDNYNSWWMGSDSMYVDGPCQSMSYDWGHEPTFEVEVDIENSTMTISADDLQDMFPYHVETLVSYDGHLNHFESHSWFGDNASTEEQILNIDVPGFVCDVYVRSYMFVWTGDGSNSQTNSTENYFEGPCDGSDGDAEMQLPLYAQIDGNWTLVSEEVMFEPGIYEMYWDLSGLAEDRHYLYFNSPHYGWGDYVTGDDDPLEWTLALSEFRCELYFSYYLDIVSEYTGWHRVSDDDFHMDSECIEDAGEITLEVEGVTHENGHEYELMPGTTEFTWSMDGLLDGYDYELYWYRAGSYYESHYEYFSADSTGTASHDFELTIDEHECNVYFYAYLRPLSDITGNYEEVDYYSFHPQSPCVPVFGLVAADDDGNMTVDAMDEDFALSPGWNDLAIDLSGMGEGSSYYVEWYYEDSNSWNGWFYDDLSVNASDPDSYMLHFEMWMGDMDCDAHLYARVVNTTDGQWDEMGGYDVYIPGPCMLPIKLEVPGDEQDISSGSTELSLVVDHLDEGSNYTLEYYYSMNTGFHGWYVQDITFSGAEHVDFTVEVTDWDCYVHVYASIYNTTGGNNSHVYSQSYHLDNPGCYQASMDLTDESGDYISYTDIEAGTTDLIWRVSFDEDNLPEGHEFELTWYYIADWDWDTRVDGSFAWTQSNESETQVQWDVSVTDFDCNIYVYSQLMANTSDGWISITGYGAYLYPPCEPMPSGWFDLQIDDQGGWAEYWDGWNNWIHHEGNYDLRFNASQLEEGGSYEIHWDVSVYGHEIASHHSAFNASSSNWTSIDFSLEIPHWYCGVEIGATMMFDHDGTMVEILSREFYEEGPCENDMAGDFSTLTEVEMELEVIGDGDYRIAIPLHWELDAEFAEFADMVWGDGNGSLNATEIEAIYDEINNESYGDGDGPMILLNDAYPSTWDIDGPVISDISTNPTFSLTWELYYYGVSGVELTAELYMGLEEDDGLFEFTVVGNADLLPLSASSLNMGNGTVNHYNESNGTIEFEIHPDGDYTNYSLSSTWLWAEIPAPSLDIYQFDFGYGGYLPSTSSLTVGVNSFEIILGDLSPQEYSLQYSVILDGSVIDNLTVGVLEELEEFSEFMAYDLSIYSCELEIIATAFDRNGVEANSTTATLQGACAQPELEVHQNYPGWETPEFVCHEVAGDPTSDIQYVNFSLVNDGNLDCGDGSDEPFDMDLSTDSDGDGDPTNDQDSWFECYDGTHVNMNTVNDGTDDCFFGEDEYSYSPWYWGDPTNATGYSMGWYEYEIDFRAVTANLSYIENWTIDVEVLFDGAHNSTYSGSITIPTGEENPIEHFQVIANIEICNIEIITTLTENGIPVISETHNLTGECVQDSDSDGFLDWYDSFPEDPSEWYDSDYDGYGDNSDAFPYDPSEWSDSDSDGYGDNSDVFPNDPEEWSDLDGDGIGDNADPDDDGDGIDDDVDDSDGDGVPDSLDDFPDDANETTDSDGDGVGDNADEFPYDPGETTDSDGDGVGDNADEFPNDASETTDSDGDGVGDNGDEFPNDGSETTDSDGDGVGDNSDEFPNDANETTDYDGDGVGDNSDDFPNDASETTDSDGDGVGDNSDEFPNDANETTDYDGDGVGDNSDDFPNDASETTDSDGDGVGDNSDEFPNDPTESSDSDGDGLGDNADDFPNDANETTDTDGDGVGNNSDEFPNDPNEWSDADSDGVGDNSDDFPNDANETADSDGDGLGDNADDFPNDANETTDSDGDGVGDNADDFPNDANETTDTDGDGIGNNADTDDDGDGIDDDSDDSDGDGVTDDIDDFPYDANETTDSDGDGVGDNGDDFPDDANETTDSDGDGVGDNADEFPEDADETTDSDGDGVGDNSDEYPDNPGEWSDSDGDGVGDNADDFPNDANETADFDGDGVGDNSDDFPYNPGEWSDSDGDGVGDNADEFPNDPTDWTDSDGDGVGDNSDDSPYDANETTDSDGDGVGDNADEFPNDASETTDSDGDGVGDNSDEFPEDANETTDTDGDGVGDSSDEFPEDPTEWSDSDGDGVGDNADLDSDGDGVDDDSDAFPNDSSEWSDSDGDGVGDNSDEFPEDPNETTDSDGDGWGDNEDAFPDDPSEFVDSDGDGVGNLGDSFPFDANETTDSDGDGWGDNSDDFPEDAEEWSDVDGDGVGDNSDEFPWDSSEWSDSDGDGWGDNSDAFPDDPDEWSDYDGDGTGDNADTDADGDGTDDADEDSDGDGVNDDDDDFPFDANETSDSDGDGVGDNQDEFPNDANESTDTDGDGVGDNSDPDADGDGTPNDLDDFPLNSGESTDSDGDGIGDEEDAFPYNPDETVDTDGDGIGDNLDDDDDNDGTPDSQDAFPRDPTSTTDTDGDGYGDGVDAFPNDAGEWNDYDGDGVGDNSDAFMTDPYESRDTDGDGYGDNSDAFPMDPSEHADSDGDGVGNNADTFPTDPSETIDTDGDGVGDNADDDADGDGIPDEQVGDVDSGDSGGILPGFTAITGLASVLGAAILVSGRRKD